MKAQKPEIVEKFDMLFGGRTGLTALVPVLAVLDVPVETRVVFRPSPENPADLVIEAAGKAALLRNVPAQHIEQAQTRGVIMFYEMKGDDVVRCTPAYKE